MKVLSCSTYQWSVYYLHEGPVPGETSGTPGIALSWAEQFEAVKMKWTIVFVLGPLLLTWFNLNSSMDK